MWLIEPKDKLYQGIQNLSQLLARSQTLFITLREKSPNTEFFLVRIFPHLDRTRRDTEDLSIFSSNAEKYRPEKTTYLDTFHAVSLIILLLAKALISEDSPY